MTNEKEEKNASNDNKKYYSYAKENMFSKCICRIFFGGGGGSMMVELFKGGGAQYELPHANCKSP